MMPKDPMMLLSLINVKLRDDYPSFHDLCEDLQWEEEEITARLAESHYYYVPSINQFRYK